MIGEFEKLKQFFLMLDGLKEIDRRTYISGGLRLENSAEHSWHLAVAVWGLANHLGRDVSVEKLLKLALVHDLGEMGAGDTFLYAENRHEASDGERACVAEIAGKYGALIPDLEKLWEEQEAGVTAEARLLKVVDRLLPFLHNIASEGKTWREHGVSRSQVLEMHAFIENEAPELFGWMKEQLDGMVTAGWIDGS